jgi:YVTN family beta-propeller protein
MTDLRHRVQAIVRVGGGPHGPDWQADGFGSVWLSNEPLNSIERIDPSTNRVVARIHVNVPCDGLGAGFGSIWVPQCVDRMIARIDPETDRVIDRIPTPVAGAQREGEGLIAVGAGGVWLMSSTSTLSRIDPTTGKVDLNVPIEPGSYAVTVGAGSIWASSSDGNVVTRVSPNGDVLATIPVGPSPLFLAAGEGGIWVLNQGDGTVSRIDPDTDQVVATIDAGAPGHGGCIAAGAGSVWVTIPGAPLTQIDPASNTVTSRFVGEGGDCLSVAYGSVWLSNHEWGNVWRISTDL